jgi:hypothetical protein
VNRDRLLAIAGVIILAVLTLVRIRLIDSLPDQGYFAKYSITADQILAGQIPRDRLLDFSSLYLWFVVAMRAIGLGLHGIRTLQIILVSVAALLVAIAARRFGRTAMFAAPIFLLGSRAALVCATDLEPETLILVLNAGALACLGLGVSGSRGLEGPSPRDCATARPRDFYLAGILLGLSAACRPVALLVVIGLAIVCRSWRMVAGATIPIVIILGVNLAITGELTLMDPGTVFYEGMNPNATGYQGVQPGIVNDLERQSRDPDYLHVAYRVVAARALGHPVTRAESNRYWTGKALAFARAYPWAAVRLTARKFYFALHSYDAFDLVTMARKNFLLARYPFIPFGVLVALALAAIVLRVRGIAPLVVFTCAIGITLVLFYVTARQRNALLPPLVILAAAGLAEIIARRHVLAVAAAVVIAVLLSINGPAQREDAAGWLGERNAFDQAIALEQGERWGEADALLQRLEGEGYRPIRENRAVSSIAYYRARAAAHLGRDPRPFLARAEREAPGNEHVLAMEAAYGDRRAERLLFDLHDPFTARHSLAAARQ